MLYHLFVKQDEFWRYAGTYNTLAQAEERGIHWMCHHSGQKYTASHVIPSDSSVVPLGPTH